jgi:hypothetical protein
MGGGEAAVVWTLADRLGRPPADGCDAFERRSAALAGTPDDARDLIAGAQSVLADDPLADMYVTLGREIARLPPPKKSGPAAGYVEDTQRLVIRRLCDGASKAECGRVPPVD